MKRRVSIAAAVIAGGLIAGGVGAGVASASTASAQHRPTTEQTYDKLTCAVFAEWYDSPGSASKKASEVTEILNDSRLASMWLLDDTAMWVNTHENTQSWTVNMLYDCGMLGSGG